LPIQSKIAYPIFFAACLLLLWQPASVAAQDKQAPAGNDLVKQLITAYNNFDYEKSRELLNIAFNSIDKFSPEDQKQIYQYAAFIAFQNGNIPLTENHFWHVLQIDPTYTPDPVTTSPKLLTLFQKTKIEFLEDMNRRLKTMQQQRGTRREIPWRGLLFPGWEQWHRGYHTRGVIYSGLAAATLGSLIYTAILTRDKKADYDNAGSADRSEIAALYNDYNSSYQRQFYFGYAFIGLWAFSQVDLALWSKPSISLSPAVSYGAGNSPVLSACFRVEF